VKRQRCRKLQGKRGARVRRELGEERKKGTTEGRNTICRTRSDQAKDGGLRRGSGGKCHGRKNWRPQHKVKSGKVKSQTPTTSTAFLCGAKGLKNCVNQRVSGSAQKKSTTKTGGTLRELRSKRPTQEKNRKKVFERTAQSGSARGGDHPQRGPGRTDCSCLQTRKE